MNPRLALVFTLVAGVSINSLADTLSGKVVGVTDGDTITLLDGQQAEHKIRLMGIDAPEKSQPYGQTSKSSLSDLVFGHAVDVEWQKLDRYGRVIGKVMVGGQDANLEQVRRGLAWHYKKYEGEQEPIDRARYSQEEIEARSVHRGLWADPDPIPPWDWRKSRR